MGGGGGGIPATICYLSNPPPQVSFGITLDITFTDTLSNIITLTQIQSGKLRYSVLIAVEFALRMP